MSSKVVVKPNKSPSASFQSENGAEVVQNLKNGRYNKKRQSSKEGGNEKADSAKE